MAEVTSPDRVVAPRAPEWQAWDATAPAGTDAGTSPWRKLPGGPADMATGDLTGDDFPSSGPWRQC